jgi:hypothetical protein
VTFPALSIARDALPPPDEVQIQDVQPFVRTPWPGNLGGAVQHRDRRPAGATAVEVLAVWLSVPKASLDAFRLHHRSYQTGAPWKLSVPCDGSPWRVQYAGPLQIAPISNAFSRVSVLVSRSLPIH